MRLLDGQEEERSGWKGGRAEGSGDRSSPRSMAAAVARLAAGGGTIAEPWVGVDSSKPPRLFATVVALVASDGLATPERLKAAAAGTILAPHGAILSVARGVNPG